jgi:hypothetical protein
MKKTLEEKLKKDPYWKEHLEKYPITSEIFFLFPYSMVWKESKETREKAIELIDELEKKYIETKEYTKKDADWVTIEVFPGAKKYFAKADETAEQWLFLHYIEDFRLIEGGLKKYGKYLWGCKK